jgi:seryl-tRNA synthetase
MLDIKFIRQNPEIVKEGVKNKGFDVDIDRLLELDEKRRELIKKLDALKAKRNEISGRIKGEPELMSQAKALKEEIKAKEAELKDVKSDFEELLLAVPNLPFKEVPPGKDEKDNVIVKEWGKKPKFGFEPKNYLEIAQNLDIIDVKRAAKVSGTRFGYLKKEAVFLEFALINFAFDFLVKKGFVAVVPPVMIKPEMMKAMGYVETKEDLQEVYYLEKDNLFLVATSEQSIGPMHADEVFEEKDLPKRYVAFSSCFRREAGSYGKDTKGILRVHQFDKVEMFSFTRPQDSQKEHQFLLSLEEELMQKLALPYRVVQMCTADLAFPQAAKYDIEAWMPGQGEYRETHSTSNCTDFQARRLNIRYKKQDGKLGFVHTLNGTAFAIGRTLIAIIENYQQKDGSVKIPRVLQKYIIDSSNLKIQK